MTWYPLESIPRKFFNSTTGDPYTGYWLIAFEAGTTTRANISIDKDGGGVAAKFQTNANGRLVTSGDALMTPHVDQKVKIALVPTEAEADASDTSNNVLLLDNVAGNITSDGFIFPVWEAVTGTPTRTANGVFTLPTDQTAKIKVGSRLKFTDNGNTEYGIAVSSVFSSVTTFTCLVTANLTANLTEIAVEAKSDQGVAKSIHVDARTYLATAATTITKTLKFDDGGVIDMQSNALTFSGSPAIKAGIHQIFSNLGTVTGRCRVKSIFPEWFGAEGDDSTDDKDAFADTVTFAEGITGAARILCTANYRVSKTSGTNDKWGVNIKGNGITLEFLEGSTIRRFSSDISTYAKSFPILLVGTPDSNVASATNKFKLKGGEWIGEDSRHSDGGNAIFDGRQAIWMKNTKNARIINTDFTSIDSGAIYFQRPGLFDYENSQYYNETKNYNCKILSNNFIAESHAVAGRALIHVIEGSGCDNLHVINNYSEWCDDLINYSTTYDDYEDLETDTYTDSNLATLVKRTARGLTINNNTCYNSSEHCFYLEGMGITCQGNTIIVDNPTVCNTYQFQIRCRGGAISGNTFIGVHSVASINVGSIDVTFSSNHANCVGDNQGGMINIQSNGMKTYIDNRSSFFSTSAYKPMQNINVIGNTLEMDSGIQTHGVGIRLYASDADAVNFPDGDMRNINVSGNIINNAKQGFIFLTPEVMIRNVAIKNNTLNGKPFTEATFTTGTTMNSIAVMSIDDSASYAEAFRNIEFSGNTCYGFEYVIIDNDGAGGVGSGGAGTFYLPFGFDSNTFNYFKYFDTAAFRAVDFINRFVNNNGKYFLERSDWYTVASRENSLSTTVDDNTTSRKSCISSTSGTHLIYVDDTGTGQAI